MAVDVLILGARTFAEEVADFASEIPGVRITAFVENLDRNHPPEVRGIPVLWVDAIASMAGTHQAVCALSTTRRRTYVDQVAALGFEFATLIHPTAHVSRTATLGAGCIVAPGVIVAAYAKIGAHVILNRGALIGHHLQIGNFSTVGPGAKLGGCSHVGERVYVGIGATVIDRMSVGAGSVIGAGAVVVGDVPEHSLAVGVPAKVVRSGIEPK